VISASVKSDVRFPADTASQITRFTEFVATAIENAVARAELAASRARIVATADQTRRRIERDLHDGVQQHLVSLALRLRATQATMPAGLAGRGRELEGIGVDLVDAVDELREVASGIHPVILVEGGLVLAVKALARRSRIPVHLRIDATGRLPERVEATGYYVVSEALTNAVRHAQASIVTVTVEIVDEILRIGVHDDGIGGADFTSGTGLLGLKDRVEVLGGRLHIDSPRGAGTTLQTEFSITD